MTPETLSSIVAMILSLLASYSPGFAPWYKQLSTNYKRLLMLGLLALVSLGSYGLACAKIAASLNIPVTCDESGAIALIKAFIAAIVANQAAYLISPDAKKEKDERRIDREPIPF